MDILVHGLTFSGHPTRTTFGNTIRMTARLVYMIVIILKKQNFVLVVGGDDVNIWVPEEDYTDVLTCLKKLNTVGTVASSSFFCLNLKPLENLCDEINLATTFYSKNILITEMGPTFSSRFVVKLFSTIWVSSSSGNSSYWAGRAYAIYCIYADLLKDLDPKSPL